MLIGRRDIFGIEYEVNDRNDPLYLFGKLRFWFNGDAFGHFDDEVSLADVHSEITGIVKDAGHRDEPALFALGRHDLFHGIRKAFEEDRGDIAGVRVETWARFAIAPGFENFGFRDAYAVSDGGRYRVLYESAEGDIREFEAHDVDIEGPFLEYWQRIDSLLG